MCNRGTWDGFAIENIRGHDYIAEQCSECGSYQFRLVTDDMDVIAHKPATDSANGGWD